MTHNPSVFSSNELDELKRVKEAFQLEMVSTGGLSTMRKQFLYDTIGLLNLSLMDEDDELANENR